MKECECSYIKFSDGEIVHSINCSKNSFFNLENRHGFTSLGIEDVKKDYEKLKQELAKLKEENEKYKMVLEKIIDLHAEDGSAMQRYAYEALGE